MMKTILFALFVSTAVLCRATQDYQKSSQQLLFESYLSNYSRKYVKDDETEKNYRFKIFQQSLARQKALNDYEKENGGSAVFGVNKFSDLTLEEFQKLSLSPPRKTMGGSAVRSFDTSHLSGTRFDWRDQGVIGPIRDQSKCGSCWAFAVVETVGSAYAIKKKEKIKHILSAQQLISCEQKPGLDGCSGGVLVSAFSTLKDDGVVLVDDSVYPFRSKDGEDHTCQPNLPNQGVMLTNFSYSEKVELPAMVEWLKTSPLTTSVNAVPWQDYIGGIIQHHCTDTYVDHAVQVVGYDFTGDRPFWIIRNTWGPDWGEHGYIRILYSNDNLCGLQDEVAAVHGTLGIDL